MLTLRFSISSGYDCLDQANKQQCEADSYFCQAAAYTVINLRVIDNFAAVVAKLVQYAAAELISPNPKSLMQQSKIKIYQQQLYLDIFQ